MKKNKHISWMIAVLIFICTAAFVQITLNNTIYLPVIVVVPTLTPSPTPKVTLTPTLTATPDYDVSILKIVNSDTVDPLDEYVSIKNYGYSATDLTDWYIRDDGPNRYNFPDNFNIARNQTVRLWTKEGVNTATDLYWGSAVEVWNDSSDCAWLRDNSGGEKILVDTYCY